MVVLKSESHGVKHPDVVWRKVRMYDCLDQRVHYKIMSSEDRSALVWEICLFIGL